MSELVEALERAIQPPRASGKNNDPLRPIVPRSPMLDPKDCSNPWSRIAHVETPDGIRLQCFDCGEYMKVNSVDVVIPWSQK